VTWYAIEVQADADRRDAVAAWLIGRTGQAVEERPDGTLISFALDLPAAEALERDLAAVHGPGLPMAHREVPEVDWTTAWRTGLGKRRIGRFTIVPSWLDHSAAPDELAIIIDPEMAFGSGEHGSTRAALTLLDHYARKNDTILDLGTGSGILTIAARMLGASCAVGVDVDAESLVVAATNAERNGVAGQVTFLEGDAAQLVPLLAPADLIVSNILRLVNVALLPEIGGALRRGGVAIFSGMEGSEADSFRRSLRDAGFILDQEVMDEGWWAIAVRRA
jgi:ribosomal protein L11 methyltransferase